MPGGRFQAFSDQEGLGCLERTHGSSVAEESLSRQNSSGSRSGRTLSQPEASETEEQRSRGMTDTREVREGLGGRGPRCPVPNVGVVRLWQCRDYAYGTDRVPG